MAHDIALSGANWIGDLSCACCGEYPNEQMVNLAEYTGYFCRSCLLAGLRLAESVARGQFEPKPDLEGDTTT